MVICAGCDRPILERFLLNVLERTWHAKCVQCSECNAPLTEKCFSRDGRLYCRDDFFRRFGTKCGGCSQGISPNDLVRRARNKVFHLKCFTCMVCRKQLSTGEELYVLDENKFICKEDYISSKISGSDQEDIEADLDTPMLDKLDDGLSEKDLSMSMSLEGDDSRDSILPQSLSTQSLCTTSPHLPLSSSNVSSKLSPNMESLSPIPASEIKLEQNNNITSTNNNNSNNTNIRDTPSADLSESGSCSESEEGKLCDRKDGDGSNNPPGAKRRGPRTTIKAKQLETLKAAFNATPKPTRHIREQLAQETGLNMRVIQVWFQNRRSKERRMKQLSALGQRRHFFRNPRMRRTLRPGEIDDGMDMIGQPGFNYPISDNGDFYPGYGGYNDYFPSQNDPSGMGFLPQGPGGPMVDQGVHPGSLGHDSPYLHGDMMTHNPSPEPNLPPMSHHDFVHGPTRSLTSGFNQMSHPPHEMSSEAW